jgi:Zn-dependent protease
MDQLGIVLLFISALSVLNGGQAFTYGFTPVNEARLRRRTQFGPALVAVAGPLMNLVLAALVAIPLTHVATLDVNFNPTIAGNTEAYNFLWALFNINVFLAVFNVVPLPPLDGWTIFSAFLSQLTIYNLRPLIQYGPMILLLLILFEPQIHFFSTVIYPATDWVSTQLWRL